MSRRVLLCAALLALITPALMAQGVTVCVFQGKESHDIATQYASDIQNVAAELDGKTLPGGAAVHAIAVPDVQPKGENAAAQSHQCGYVISVHRTEILAAPAGFAGNLNASSGDATSAHTNQSAMAQQDQTRVDYILRKTDSGKKLVNGESDSTSPWDHIADEVLKKLAREEK